MRKARQRSNAVLSVRDWIDKALAIIGTVLLHAGLVALLFSNVRWETPAPQRVATTIKAAVVDDAAFAIAEAELAEITQEVTKADEPPPEPEVDPQIAIDAAAAEQRRIEAAREQQAEEQAQAERQQKLADEVAAREREAEVARQREVVAAQQRKDEAAAREQKEAAERERQAAAERKRKEEAERTRKEEAERKRKEDAERKRKEDAERKRKADAERKRKADAERKRKADAERRARERQAELDAQLRDAMIAEEARQGAVNSGLLAQYVELIRQDVERNWNRPPGVADGIRCEVRVRQLRSGEVVSVQVVDCAGGEVLIRSIEAAVYKASPLPLPPDPSLFERNLLFPFKTGE